jgi:hypothetical protein
MSAPTPPPDPDYPRAVKCLASQAVSGSHIHVCSKSLDHADNHQCNGIVGGCGHEWPRRS